MRVGVLGGGQLGRMLALAGYPLGLQFRFYDPSPEAPAGQCAELVVGSYGDERALARFAEGLDVATYEFENVSLNAVRFLARLVSVVPGEGALAEGQDRLHEKSCFERAGIPVAPFAAAATQPELERAVERVGLPAVVKTRRLGYDGKGQQLVRTAGDVSEAWSALGGVPLLVEAFVSFSRELSMLAVRARTGETAFYPLVENHHADGILRLSRAPAHVRGGALQALAESHAARVLDALDYVGVLAIEFFEVDGRLLANEMAPRVHNSGHWTIEGAATSQFENHLRAILGLPLGACTVVGHVAMVNLIGTTPDPAAVLAVPNAHLHLYGKTPRAGRKLGHVTVRAAEPEALEARLDQLRAAIGASSGAPLPG